MTVIPRLTLPNSILALLAESTVNFLDDFEGVVPGGVGVIDLDEIFNLFRFEFGCFIDNDLADLICVSSFIFCGERRKQQHNRRTILSFHLYINITHNDDILISKDINSSGFDIRAYPNIAIVVDVIAVNDKISCFMEICLNCMISLEFFSNRDVITVNGNIFKNV